MRPLVENFIPFAPERMASIRHTRVLGLVIDDRPKTRSKVPKKPGLRLDAKAKANIAGLDEETQRMIAQVLASK